MDTPKNCVECKHNKTCKSYYGGAGCIFKKYITQIALTSGVVALCVLSAM